MFTHLANIVGGKIPFPGNGFRQASGLQETKRWSAVVTRQQNQQVNLFIKTMQYPYWKEGPEQCMSHVTFDLLLSLNSYIFIQKMRRVRQKKRGLPGSDKKFVKISIFTQIQFS